MVSSVLRQEPLHMMYNRYDWERMFRLADYHRVANMVHLGVLGKGDALPSRWRDRFFERYQEALQFSETCEESIREILVWLDMREISCTVLVAHSVREFYKLPETAENSPIQILLSEDQYVLAKGYLVDLGYETDQTYKGYGERMKRVSGVSVILYRKLPFRTALYAKNMQLLLETAELQEPYHYIRVLPPESELAYRISRTVYSYVTDDLRIREVLDLQLCHKAWRNEINKEAIWKFLTDFQIDELAEKILRISYMWFGDKKDKYFIDQIDDMSVYDVLEERILTQGTINREADEQALSLQKAIEKEILKEQKEEMRSLFWERVTNHLKEIKRTFLWIFPDYHYMSSIYPILRKIPVLLPIFWCVRDIRLLLRLLVK